MTRRRSTLTRAAYDEAAGAVLTPPDLETEASVHATGYAFDVLRRYRSEVFQWTLERLEALGLIE